MHILPGENDARTSQKPESILSYADIVMYTAKHKVMSGKQELDLLPKEYEVLEFFLRNKDRIVTRSMLLEGIWNFHFDPRTTMVETQISRLRNKLKCALGSRLIKTVRGVGYKLEAG